ncbi:MAG TPA: hypothetical protein VM409_02640 [Chloroflexia bacterium]|nr:hypothetical protein [Chloroflexia bacterium]
MASNAQKNRRAPASGDAALADTPAVDGGGTSEAYVPSRLDPPRKRTRAGTAILWAAGIVWAISMVLTLLAFFAPQYLPEFIRLPSNQAAPGGQYAPGGRISFVRSSPDGRTRDLYVVNADGTNQQQITRDIVVEGATAWSPDGRRIIAQASIEGTSRVVRFTIGPDNKPVAAESVQLTADVQADSVLPAWSPDGKHIAFQSKTDGADYQVFVMDADGNNKHRVSDGKGYAGWPTWSPDGKLILYIQGGKPDPGSVKEVYAVPPSGDNPRQLTSAGKDAGRPAWSPDGSLILYLQNNGDKSTIMLANADGSSPRVLVEASRNPSPQFSPDGKTIVYYAVAPPQGSDIFAVPVAGGTPVNLTPQSVEDYVPTWSPDGQKLAWASSQGQEHHIVTAGPDGKNPVQVSTGDGDDYQPAWGKTPTP